jgi:NAD(P)-dependent dehydrogenase (short-subunit alcohol dehydrogenase family)
MAERLEPEALKPETLFSLRGQTALLVGAGGLGRAIGLGLAAAGADLAVADLEYGRAAALAAEAAAAGRRCGAYPVDITDRQGVQALVDAVVRDFGRVHILVNAAGITRLAPAVNYPEADWDRILAVNLKGVFLTCQAAGRHMIAAGGGAIVNLSSVAAQSGLELTPAYCASKGGVDALTRALAVEWVRYGVRVNAVAPSWFETPMGSLVHTDPELYQARVGRVPMGRLGRPWELVGAVLFLVSPAASMVTGVVLPVDGGYLAQ